ncbi:MAG: ComEC/Rec2 family competence protein, partial [Parafilimonas sp.]
MPYNSSFSYKTYPFLRLLLPLIAGIIIQWYLQPSLKLSITTIAIISLLFVSFTFLKEPENFFSRWLKGILIMLFFVCLGMLITFLNNIENNPNWFGKNYKQGDAILITLQEPLADKNKSYKAHATVNAVNKDGKWQTGKGDILVYFKKGEAKPNLNYGSQLIIKKPLQPIANSGNPGALDYKRYCLFQDITGQVFLKDDEYILLPSTNIHPFWQFIFNLRDGTVNKLRRFIPGKKQQSVAEALLIGYRNDLDRDLVQSYSNTGVVHIIAISGLHLGMIYGLMLFIFSHFKKNKILGWLKPVTILSVIWLFTFVAGMAPSVLRASVMFTFIVLGEAISKKNNIYNNLAASAFCLLACNPFMLWDVGFQLSYAAVLSIVIFMHSIYNWLFIKNKLLDNAWKLSSITLSAQILTLPLILYHFHQFSNLFWLTNFIAVPLSGIILYGELILLCFSWLSGFAKFIGIITGWLVERMNSFIESIDRLPFTVWNGIEINILQAIFLYGVLIFLGIWLLNKYKPAFIASLCFLA